MKNKIKNIEELKIVLAQLKKQGNKIVTTNGVFDILHIGHVRYLEKAKKLGDILIVLVNNDSSTKKIKGKDRPINKQNDRAEILAALEFVDYVTLFKENDPRRILDSIKPNIHIKGGDYKMNQIVEKEIVEKNGGKVLILPFQKGSSTSSLIKKIIKIYH